MKLSAVVIAHNEEKNIATCIESLLNQARKIDEIIVVNHNSSDRTGEVARKYPITVIDYSGPAGPAYARIRGIEEVTGDIVLCIDGDGYAASNWSSVLNGLLSKDDTILVGSWIRMTGVLLADIAAARWYFVVESKGKRAIEYLYGGSFGFRGEYKEQAIQALKKGIELSEKLQLAYNPDDYWLALFLGRVGGVEVTNKTWVTIQAKERSNIAFLRRSFIAGGIRNKMQRYLKIHELNI